MRLLILWSRVQVPYGRFFFTTSKNFDNTWTAYHLRDNRILASYEQKKHFGHSIYFFSILYNDLKAGGGGSSPNSCTRSTGIIKLHPPWIVEKRTEII